METSIFRSAPSRTSPWSLAGAYLLALLSSIVALSATLLLKEYLEFTPLVFLYFAVFVSGRVAGFGPGLLATAITVWMAEQHVLPAPWAFQSGWRDALPLGVYVVVSMVTLAVVCTLRARTAVLREKDAQLTDFMEHATIGLHWLAEDGTIIWANKAACELLGYAPSTYIGRNVREFHWDGQQTADILRRLGRKEWLKNYPVRLRTRDGSPREVLLDANVFWQEGKFVHARCFLRDVTSRRQAEEALASEKNLLRTLIDALPDCVYTKDRESRFVISNPANVRLLGADNEEEIRGRTSRELCPGEMAERVMENDRRVVTSGAPLLDQEEIFVTPEGESRTFNTAKLPLRDAAGEIIGLVGISRDISERKKAEEAAHRINEELEGRVLERTWQLEQANRELEAFSYSISHDLRAPVRAITGFSQIIADDYGHKFDGEVARLFNLISKSGQRMGELIDDLLSFSRLSALELHRAPVDMTALARLVVKELHSQQTNGRTRVRVAELPPANGDESMLRQVITNLVANALKFSRGVAEPTVTVDARNHQNRIVYFVRDNGVGFDMKYASKLFKVFQRLHRPEQFEGTGVGLAIVQRVVHRHGGQVWAESKPGEGATFCFSLPVTDEQNGARPSKQF